MQRLAIALRTSRKRLTKYRRAIVITAATFLLIGIYISLHSLSLSLSDVDFFWIVAALLTLPVSIWLNAAELSLCAKAVGRPISIASAAFFSSLATISNLLPLPGSLLVRGGVLTSNGSSIRETSYILGAAAFLWLAIALVVTAAAMPPSIEAKFILCLSLFFTIIIVADISYRVSIAIGAGFFIIRAAMIIILIIRINFCFLALGVSISIKDSSIFSLAGIIGSGMAIVPGGIGITEGVGAVLAHANGTSSAAAFLALSMNRLIGLIAAVAILILMHTAGLSKTIKAGKS